MQQDGCTLGGSKRDCSDFCTKANYSLITLPTSYFSGWEMCTSQTFHRSFRTCHSWEFGSEAFSSSYPDDTGAYVLLRRQTGNKVSEGRLHWSLEGDQEEMVELGYEIAGLCCGDIH